MLCGICGICGICGDCGDCGDCGTLWRLRERGAATGRAALRRMVFFGLRAMMP